MKVNQIQNTALRYFLEVVRCGSIRGASQKLNVSSAAICRQINALEDILQTPLFKRLPRGMAPSPAGELLAAHARNMAQESERIIEGIQSLDGAESGSVHIACTTGFAFGLLPSLIADFRKRHSGVGFSLIVDTPQGVSKRIQNGEADLGVTFSRSKEKNICVEYARPLPITAIMRPDHPLAERQSIALSELQDYPVSVLTEDTTQRQLFDLACSLRQIKINPVLTSNQLICLRDYALASGEIFICGTVSVRQAIADGTLVSVPFTDPGLDGRFLEIQTLAGKTLPQVVGGFLAWLRDELEGCRSGDQAS